MFAVAMYVWLCVGALWLAITTVAGLTLHGEWRRGSARLRMRVLYALFLAMLCSPPACYVLGTAGDDAPEAVLPTPLLALGVPFAAVFVFALLVFPSKAFRGPGS